MQLSSHDNSSMNRRTASEDSRSSTAQPEDVHSCKLIQLSLPTHTGKKGGRANFYPMNSLREKSPLYGLLTRLGFFSCLVTLLHWGSPLVRPLNSWTSKAHYCHAGKGHHHPPGSSHQFRLWVLQTSSSQ